jgi:hypothetical protein
VAILILEVVSECQIAFESPAIWRDFASGLLIKGAQQAQTDEKAQHTCEYVSILKRSATRLSDARWCFETASGRPGQNVLKMVRSLFTAGPYVHIILFEFSCYANNIEPSTIGSDKKFTDTLKRR